MKSQSKHQCWMTKGGTSYSSFSLALKKAEICVFCTKYMSLAAVYWDFWGCINDHCITGFAASWVRSSASSPHPLGIRKNGEDRSALSPRQNLCLPRSSCSGEGEAHPIKLSQIPIPATGAAHHMQRCPLGSTLTEGSSQSITAGSPRMLRANDSCNGNNTRSGLLYWPAKLVHLNPHEFFQRWSSRFQSTRGTGILKNPTSGVLS